MAQLNAYHEINTLQTLSKHIRCALGTRASIPIYWWHQCTMHNFGGIFNY